MGGTRSDQADAIALDSSGGLYIAGYFLETAAFGTRQLSNGGAFFAKLNSSGDFQWVTKAGQSGTYGDSIAINGAGEILVAGELSGSVAFGSTTVTQRGSWDGYVAKLSPSGSFLWATNAGGSIYDDTSFVAASGDNAYLAGAFDATNMLGSLSLATTASKALFLTKITTQTKPVIFINGTNPNTNSFAASGPVQISIQSGYLTPAIYYTLDGSQPSFDSFLFSGPFTLYATATLRVIAYRSDFLESQQSDPIVVTIPRTFELLATTDGGGVVTATPPNAGTRYRTNTPISIFANPTAPWIFLGWAGDADGANNPLALTMSADTCVKAIFGTSLSTSTVGAGSVSITPTVPTYPYGTVITLRALPSLGNYFGAWGNAASGNTNPQTFAVTSPAPTISAIFSPLGAGMYALVVQPAGAGRVSVNPHANRYTSGQNITITALPDPGQQFLGWEGDASGAQNPLSLIITHSSLVTAAFSKYPRLAFGDCPTMNASPVIARVLLVGALDSRYEIQTSENLYEWSPRANLTNSFGWVQFTEPLSNSPSQKFYRARLIQP